MHTFSRPLAALAIVSLSLVAGACTHQHATYTPDGRRGYAISCEGYLNNYTSCLDKAGRACGANGYDILHGGDYSVLHEGTDDERDILIACKAPAPKP